jgi:hypothetical protein
MQSSHSLHDMRDLLRCGAPVRDLRFRPAPTPDQWELSSDPVNADLHAEVMRHSRAKDELRRACFAFDRICIDVVKPRRQTNLQWRVLDDIMGHVQVPIHRLWKQINDTQNFFKMQREHDPQNSFHMEVNRRFYTEQGRLEARHELLADLLRDAQSTLTQLYVETGLYTASNSVMYDTAIRPHTEKELWDSFCARIDSL